MTIDMEMLIISIVVILISIPTVRSFFKIKKAEPRAIIFYFLRFVPVAVMVLSWIFNMGWLRIILTFFPLPIAHLVFFGVASEGAMMHLSKSPRLKIYIPLSYLTFALAYAFFADGGDIGGLYNFFGLIRNEIAATLLFFVAAIAFIANNALSIMQMIEVQHIKAKLQLDKEVL